MRAHPTPPAFFPTLPHATLREAFAWVRPLLALRINGCLYPLLIPFLRQALPTRWIAMTGSSILLGLVFDFLRTTPLHGS